MLPENIKAPDFHLPDQNEEEHYLSDYERQWVLIYFYPKDDTSGCTKEACGFRDNMPDFEKLKIKILGISADSAESHAKFVSKYGLNFTLLSDQKKEVIKTYGASITKRISYLIDPKGMIRKAYSKVTPAEHAEEVLVDLEAMGVRGKK